MNYNLKNFSLFLISLVGAFIFAKPFGFLYENVIGRPSDAWFWGVSSSSVNGFVIAIFFLFPLLLSFGGKNKYYYILGLLIIFFVLFWGYLEGLFLMFIFSVSGLILGTLLNWLYKKVARKK